MSHTIHGTGIFTCLLVDFCMENVGKYAIHGWYGCWHVMGIKLLGCPGTDVRNKG